MKNILPIFINISLINVGLGFSPNQNLNYVKFNSRSKLKFRYYDKPYGTTTYAGTRGVSILSATKRDNDAPFFARIERKDDVILTDSNERKTFQEYSTPLLTTDNSTNNNQQLANTKAKITDIEVLQSKSVNGAEIKEILDKLYDPKDFYAIILSLFIGLFSGCSVALFKLAVEKSSEIFYGPYSAYLPPYLIPLTGGIVVSLLMLISEFPPGLRGTANEIDSLTLKAMKGKDDWAKFFTRFLAKSFASISTLGSGNSLGPEGPSVEVGMAMTRTVMSLSSFDKSGGDILSKIRLNRLLLSAGAAAGVSAGFNAPLTGIFFALEVIQPTLPPIKIPSTEYKPDQNTTSIQEDSRDFFIAPIVLASVLSALVSHVFLGNSLILRLPPYNLKEPLVELPLYLLLGVLSGVVSALFQTTAQNSKAFFDGETGPNIVRSTMKSIPSWVKPSIGALICGLIGIIYPQVLFFGYVTLNSLLAPKSYVDTNTMLQLLGAKIFSTAICAGSGLVGGTFAPSLFLGGMAGASFHNIIESLFHFIEQHSNDTIMLQLADRQAYAMVGAASVLAALFRAPLTASLLLFELTRDYDVILPLLASAGVGEFVGDFLEKLLEETRRDKDPVSWGDLADDEEVLKNTASSQ